MSGIIVRQKASSFSRDLSTVPSVFANYLIATKPSFGELALLYNAPRAASIKAKTECVAWSLDRDTFNNIVKDASMRKREKYENFLKSIELLESMDPYERSKIADALKVVKCKKGEYVVK